MICTCITGGEICPKETFCIHKSYHQGKARWHGGWGQGACSSSTSVKYSLPLKNMCCPWMPYMLITKGEQAVGDHPQLVHMACWGESIALSWSKRGWQEFSLWNLPTKWRWKLPRRMQLQDNMFPLEKKSLGIQVNPQEMEARQIRETFSTSPYNLL